MAPCSRLKLGIIVAAIMTVVMAVTRLHRGVIMWGKVTVSLAYAIVAVVFLKDMWAVHYRVRWPTVPSPSAPGPAWR